jgi:hypothetical protein
MEVPPNLNATAQPIESNENKMSCRATRIAGSSSPFCCCVAANERPERSRTGRVEAISRSGAAVSAASSRVYQMPMT